MLTSNAKQYRQSLHTFPPIESQIVMKGVMVKSPIQVNDTKVLFPRLQKLLSSNKQRFFVLERDGMFSYYRDQEKYLRKPGSKSRELLLRPHYSVVRHPDLRRSLILDVDTHTVQLDCQTEENAAEWNDALNGVIQNVANAQKLGNVEGRNQQMTMLKGKINAQKLNTLHENSTKGIPCGPDSSTFDANIRDSAVRASMTIGTTTWMGKPLDALGEKYFDLLVDRRGINETAYMSTTGVMFEVKQKTAYELRWVGNKDSDVSPIDKPDFDHMAELEAWDADDDQAHQESHRHSATEIQPDLNLSPTIHEIPFPPERDVVAEDLQRPATGRQPRYLEVEYTWNTGSAKLDKDNVLGNTTNLHVNAKDLIIPINKATKENLQFFTAVLLEVGDPFTFELPHYKEAVPMTIMDVGKTYAKDFIMYHPDGEDDPTKYNGAYLEWHDVPHFHMPLNDKTGGFLVLGVVDEKVMRLAAFSIPFGKAIYMHPYTLHNDCFLIGEFGCVYASSSNYATGTVVNKDGKFPDFKFIKPENQDQA